MFELPKGWRSGGSCCVVAPVVVVSESLAQESSIIATIASVKTRMIDFVMGRIVGGAAGASNWINIMTCMTAELMNGLQIFLGRIGFAAERA